MNKKSPQSLPTPDKKIPAAVILIGCFELTIALLGGILLALVGKFNVGTMALLVLLVIYGAMGAGLLAIQEWARFTNVVLNLIAIPYVIFTAVFLDGPSDWRMISQILIAGGTVYALTRPEIRHKYQTVVPKRKIH